MKMGATLRRFGILPGLAACVAVPAPGMAKEPLRLAPSSKWHVNYADDSCRLARSFGTGEEAVVLTLDRFQPGPMVYLTLAGKPVEVRGVTRTMMLQFGPDEPKRERSFSTGNLKDRTPAVIVDRSLLLVDGGPEWEAAQTRTQPSDERGTKLPNIDPARYAAVTYLAIDIRGKQSLVLETGPMAAVESALGACTADLLRGWGIDVEAHRKLSRIAIPKSNPGDWLTSSDYPTAMLHGGNQANVDFRLIVDETGKPKSCNIQQSTRPEAFDEAVCKGIMRRAAFDPALDADGKPVASYYLNRVRFRM